GGTTDLGDERLRDCVSARHRPGGDITPQGHQTVGCLRAVAGGTGRPDPEDAVGIESRLVSMKIAAEPWSARFREKTSGIRRSSHLSVLGLFILVLATVGILVLAPPVYLLIAAL